MYFKYVFQQHWLSVWLLVSRSVRLSVMSRAWAKVENGGHSKLNWPVTPLRGREVKGQVYHAD